MLLEGVEAVLKGHVGFMPVALWFRDVLFLSSNVRLGLRDADTMTTWRYARGSRKTEVARVRITNAGRRALDTQN